jgi:hypothetical protein
VTPAELQIYCNEAATALKEAQAAVRSATALAAAYHVALPMSHELSAFSDLDFASLADSVAEEVSKDRSPTDMTVLHHTIAAKKLRSAIAARAANPPAAA